MNRDHEIARRGFAMGKERAPWPTPDRDSSIWPEIVASVDFMLGGDDRASDGEQKAEAGNLAPASPVVHPTPPGYPTIRMDDPRFKEWEKELGPAIVTAQEARAAALEEAAQIAEKFVRQHLHMQVPAIAAAIRAAK
jgi:hypothetical protein